MKYFIIVAALSGISFGIKAQKTSSHEKQLQLEQTKRFSYCGKLCISQNFPNPMIHGKSSLIYYRAIGASSAEIVVYDKVGKIALVNNVEPGIGEFEIHANQLKPGDYYYALVVDGRRVFKKKLIVL